MNLYSRARKHIDMNRVKELREGAVKEQKIAEVMEQQEETLAELKRIEIKEDPKFSNWRRDLENVDVIEEGMTASSLFSTTLSSTGDEVNSEIVVNDSGSFSADSGAYIVGGGGSFAPFDYTIDGNFNGTLSGQSAFTFSAPFNVSGDVTPHRANIESFDQSTNTFTVNDDTITFSAIAGNSSSNGSGLGSNGGTRPTNPLYVTLVVTEDDGSETLVTLGSVPRTTTSLTNFEFKIPQSAFGKQAYLNLYNQQYTTANNWWYGTTLPWHPEGVNDNGVVEDFHMILNHANLNPASGWPSISKTSIALQAWTDMQQAYAGSSWYNDGGPAGYPAPVSGGTRKLGEQDAEGNTIPEAMTMADLEYIVNYIESTFAQYRGMTTTTYGITNLQFKRQLPMNVFVGLDDPDASSFVRDGDFDRLSPADKKKKLEEQLAASKEYLDKMFGEGMIGTATQIADYEPQQSFMDIASDARNPMGTGDQAFDREMTALLASPMVQAAAAKGIAALAALVGGVGTAKQIMKSIDAGKYGGEYGSDAGPGVDARSNPGDRDTPSMDGRHQQERDAADQAIKDAEAQYGQDSEEARQARQNKNDTMTRQRKERKEKNVRPPIAKQDQREHYKPQGEVIKEKKTFKDLTKKIPGYYDGKPSPLGFPVEEPPKMKNGYHPDLVDGKKVAQRFNRLDPISARAMPKTGNPHIDKKVRAAAKKPK